MLAVEPVVTDIRVTTTLPLVDNIITLHCLTWAYHYQHQYSYVNQNGPDILNQSGQDLATGTHRQNILVSNL